MITCYVDGKLSECDISDCNSCKKPNQDKSYEDAEINKYIDFLFEDEK